MSTNKTTPAEQTRDELIDVLASSLYVGAKRESIELVLAYCEATGLDPMQKSVNIVAMNAKNPQTGNYEWRDVILPGIGFYRIQADRSKVMAGITEPEFGPITTANLKDMNNKEVQATFPEWCKITVKKIVGEHIVDFTVKEYWLENYATDSDQSTAPNSTWRKRSRGQLAKCAEAQALRKAFPEVGAHPTAEEMEGKSIGMPDNSPAQNVEFDDVISEDKFNKMFLKWEKKIQDGKQTPEQLLEFIAKKEIKLGPGHIDLIKKVEVNEK